MGETKKFPDMIDKARLAPTITSSGNVRPELKESGGDAGVTFWAPTAKMTATAALLPDCEPDPATVEVGWVQVVEHTSRIAVYELDGKVVHRQIAAIGESSRDVLNVNDTTRFFNPGAERKVTLSTANPAQAVTMDDGPSQWFPRTNNGGTLTHLTGEDRFRTSLMAAPAGDQSKMIPLKTFEWAVPWDCKVDIIKQPKKGKGLFASGGGETAKSADAKPLSINRNAALDKTEAQDKNTNGLGNQLNFTAYATVDEAAARLDAAPGSFFGELKVAKEADHDTYWNMVGALWKSNKCFKLAVVPDDKDCADEQFDVEFAGTAKFPLSGSSRTKFAALGHMVYDPANLPAAYSITINGEPVATLASPTASDSKSVTIKKKKPGFLADKTFAVKVTWSFGDP